MAEPQSKCERCGKVLYLSQIPVHVVRCKSCNQFGYLCSSCKRQHPKLHNHPTPLRLVKRESLLQEEDEQVTPAV